MDSDSQQTGECKHGIEYGEECRDCEDDEHDELNPPSIPTRQEISEVIALQAPDVPFTMPFFLASELLKECRRQKLWDLEYEGTDYLVTVRISPSETTHET